MSMQDIWRCPQCKGPLINAENHLRCNRCPKEYESIGGVPDLRLAGDSWIDFDEDRAIARELAASGHLSLEGLVRSVYARRPGWDESRVALRTRQVLEGPKRLESEVTGWLDAHTQPGRLALDLGCGAGMLLAAAAKKGCQGIGVDVSMAWLIVAKRLIGEHGGQPVLAAALGEALPLAADSVDAVISLDVIEHVRAPGDYLKEINRVTRSGGRLALSTPNRFSLTAEPHVFVWGVGWLPAPLQARYVRWASGKTYDDTRLMSSFGLRRLIRAHTRFNFSVQIPPVSDEEIARFSPFKAQLARWYNRLRSFSAARWFFLMFGPFFRLVGTKS
jgi:SAM-dependent methyltransferase